MRALVVIDETTLQSGIDTVARRWLTVGPLLRDRLDHLCIANLRGAPSLNRRLKDAGVDSVGLDCPSNGQAIKAIAEIRRLHRARGFDVIQGEETIPALISSFAFTRSSRPLIAYHRYHEEGRTLHALVSRAAVRRSDKVMVATAAVKHWAVQQDRTEREKICVVGEGVADMGTLRDSDELERLRTTWSIPEDAPIVLVVARLRPEKGVDLLLEAARKLPLPGVKPVIVVVGDGPQRDFVERIAANLDIEVRFAGHQSDLAPWYQVAALVVMPSRKEAFGMVAAEAMSAARPIVATAVGGLTEVIRDGIDGVLVPPNDPEEMIHAIIDLLQDPERLSEMGRSGRTRYESEHHPARMVDRWVECWSESGA